eukprot:768713-Hanusia_phi.AAC.6
MDMGNREFAALRFNPSTMLWDQIVIDPARPAAVPGDKVLYALTSSFSVYASAAQPASAAASTTTTTTPEGSKLNRGAIIGGVVGGFCGFVLLMAIASYVFKRKSREEQQLVLEPVKSSAALAYTQDSPALAEPQNLHGVPLLQAPVIPTGLPVAPSPAGESHGEAAAGEETARIRPVQYVGFA